MYNTLGAVSMNVVSAFRSLSKSSFLPMAMRISTDWILIFFKEGFFCFIEATSWSTDGENPWTDPDRIWRSDLWTTERNLFYYREEGIWEACQEKESWKRLLPRPQGKQARLSKLSQAVFYGFRQGEHPTECGQVMSMSMCSLPLSAGQCPENRPLCSQGIQFSAWGDRGGDRHQLSAVDRWEVDRYLPRRHSHHRGG